MSALIPTSVAARAVTGQDLVIFGDGEQQRDFVHVDDIVAGTLASLDASPGTFNLETGRATSVNQLTALLTERLGVARQPVHRAAQAGELRYCVADITAAVEFLGYRPARSLETHVDDVIESIRSKLKRPRRWSIVNHMSQAIAAEPPGRVWLLAAIVGAAGIGRLLGAVSAPLVFDGYQWLEVVDGISLVPGRVSLPLHGA